MRRRSVGSDGAYRLAEIEFFAGLSAAHYKMLARLVDELEAEPGEVLMDEGELGHEAIFIEQGSADVLQGGERVNTVGPGEIVGELALLDGAGTRTASVVASSPLRALSLTSSQVREIRSRMPDLAAAISEAATAHHERDRLRGSSDPAA